MCRDPFKSKSTTTIMQILSDAMNALEWYSSCPSGRVAFPSLQVIISSIIDYYVASAEYTDAWLEGLFTDLLYQSMVLYPIPSPFLDRPCTFLFSVVATGQGSIRYR
jgi:hypothetical protein